jgi:hypothetical protein
MLRRLAFTMCCLAALAAAVEWDSIVPLTTNGANQTVGYAGQRSVAADGLGNLHVVWLDNRTVPYQVWYRKYDHAAGVWLPETTLSTRSANCFAPTVACDVDGNVHVAWHIEFATQAGIWYKRYSAASHRWQSDTLLVPAPYPGILYSPSIACRPGTRVVHLAWCGNAESLMYSPVFHCELVPDSGWRAVERVSEYECLHTNAAIACDSAGDLCLAWAGYDLGAATQQVFCRRRLAGVWQATEFVSDNTGSGSQYWPAVSAGANGWFGVIWYGVVNSWQRILYRQCTPTRWMDVEQVSGVIQRQQRHASVACRGAGDGWAAWCGQDTMAPPCYQLRYSARSPAGEWSAPENLSSITDGDVAAPSIAADADSGLHVVWHDYHTGDNNVYYRRGHVPAAVSERADSPLPDRVGTRATIASGNRLRLGQDPGTSVTFFDAAGRIAAVRPVAASADGCGQVSVAGLRAGVYVIRSDRRPGTTFRLVRLH